jgi:type IV pilus assembly protein PilN
MPRINLLPWREADRKRKRQEFIVGAVGALVIAGLLGLAVNLKLESAVSAQNERNQLIKDQIVDVDKQITEILDLEARKEKLKARIEVIEQLQRSRPVVVHLIDQLVRTLPDGVYYTSVKQTGDQLQFAGIAQSSTRVSALMRNIESSEYLSDPSLGKVATTKEGSEFSLSAKQTGQAVEAPTSSRKGAAQRGKKAGVAP